MLSVVYQNVHNLINQQHTDDVSWINNGLYYPIRSQSYKTSNRELRGVEIVVIAICGICNIAKFPAIGVFNSFAGIIINCC